MNKAYVLLAAMAAMVACSVEETPSNESKEGMVTLSASIAQAEDITRTTIADTDESSRKSIVWNEGDSISISAGGSSTVSSNNKFTLVSGTGTTQGSFHGQQPSGTSSYFGVYPYNASTELVNASSSSSNPQWQIDFTWDGQAQSATPGTYDPTKALMMGSTQFFADGIALKNVMAYVKLTTNYNCKSIAFASNNGEKIACKSMRIGMNSDGVPEVVSTYKDTSAVTLTGANGEDIEPGTYLIPVLPVTMSQGFTVVFTSSEDKTIKVLVSSDTETTLTRSRILNLGSIDVSRLRALKGSGTEDDPFLISNLTELDYMRIMVNDQSETYKDREWNKACYKQTADIDAAGTTLTPMGNYGHPFMGSYDGGGFTISNPTYSNVKSKMNSIKAYGPVSALFGLTQGAKFNDIHVTNPQFDLTFDWTDETACYVISPIIAYVSDQSTVTNCSASGTCSLGTVSYDMVFGGIVGISTANLDLTGCTNGTATTVTTAKGSAKIGGIIGSVLPYEAEAGKGLSAEATIEIDKCRNKANITATITADNADSQADLGGIIGYAHDVNGFLSENVICNLYNCVNTGNIKATVRNASSSCNIAGIIGCHDSDGGEEDPYLINNLNRGYITAECAEKELSSCGGIVGYCYEPLIGVCRFMICVNTGMLTANCNKVGAISASDTGNYYYCRNTAGGYPICYDRSDDDNTCMYDCAQASEDAALVNYLNGKIRDLDHTESGTYCFWTITSPSSLGSLDLDF